MTTRYLDADLLIVGGGSAGCMAAIRALELNPGLRVVVFEKGDIQYSGSIARGMDALNIVAIPNFTTPELYLEAIAASSQGIVDAKASYEMAKRSFETPRRSWKHGVSISRLDKEGRIAPFSTIPREISCRDGRAGPEGDDF